MLNGIKSIIQSKKDYMESNELILEGTDITSKLDDSIVLGEETELPITGDEGGAEPALEGGEDPKDEPIEDPKPEISDEGNIEDAPIEGDQVTGDHEPTSDIMNDNIEDEEPMNIPGEDGLPTPIGKQTGETIDDTDLMTTEIDLGSNTMKDVLPVPPSGASDAVNDDIMNQRVDSGFGGDEGPATEPTPENPMGAPTEPIPATGTESGSEVSEPAPAEDNGTDDSMSLESVLFNGLENLDESTKKAIIDNLKKSQDCDKKGCKDPNCKGGEECESKTESYLITMSEDDDTSSTFTEEIIMSGDGDDSSAAPSSDAGSNDSGADTGSADAGTTEEAPAEDNPVTTAVKDKVAETEVPLEAEATEGSVRETLMKKLSSMTKSIEDVKLQVQKLAQ